MGVKVHCPSRRELLIVLAISLSYLSLTTVFVGLRAEHLWMLCLYLVLFCFNTHTRKLAVGLLPFLLFGVSYDWMRVFPNYMVNTVDVRGLYELEKELFGVSVDGMRLTLCEYFNTHASPILDFLCGVFYLGWVPIPFGVAVYFYLKGDKDNFLRFGMVFLFVNLIGFVGYYLYPAAPPWYAMNYGFDVVLDTPGNMAGLSRFDDLLGTPLFASIYGRNANVFAAVPSLHSAYLVITFFYARRHKANIALKLFILTFMFGIWFTAIYTAHHYMIDVLLGIFCACVGILIFEKVLMRWNIFQDFYLKYLKYIQ